MSRRTGFYYMFIGVSQLTAAILLLIPRTTLLGAIIYFPIILNICVSIMFYRQWLWERILEQGEVYAELKRLARLAKQGDLTLICWCFPKPCHGRILCD